jgi:hypothetical protein
MASTVQRIASVVTSSAILKVWGLEGARLEDYWKLLLFKSNNMVLYGMFVSHVPQTRNKSHRTRHHVAYGGTWGRTKPRCHGAPHCPRLSTGFWPRTAPLGHWHSTHRSLFEPRSKVHPKFLENHRRTISWVPETLG